MKMKQWSGKMLIFGWVACMPWVFAHGTAPEGKTKTKEGAKAAEAVPAKAAAKEPGADNKIRLGVIEFIAVNFPAENVPALTDTVRAHFRDVGLYTVLKSEEMKGVSKKDGEKKVPKCSDTRCLLKNGKYLGLSKIIGGEISHDGAYYAVKVNMVDIPSDNSEGQVWLASECGEQDIGQIIRAAVLRLHGQAKDSLPIVIKDYRGPEFTHYKMWALSAGAAIITGLAYSMIDGGFSGRDNNQVEIPGAYQTTSSDALSGVPGAFVNLGYGARAHALGNAYVAVSNDASGILWNPAGVARIQKSEATASYLRTMAGIPYVNAGYVGRFSRTGAFGAALLYSGDSYYGETEFITTCAKLFDSIHRTLRPFSLGVNMKIRTASFGQGGEGAWRSTGNSFGLGFDAGLQVQLADYIQMGLVAQDLLNFQRWHNTATDKSYSESVPAGYILGGAFQASPTLLLVMDGHIPGSSDETYKMNMGLEKIIFDILALRAGLSQHLDFWENRRIMGGFGLSYRGFGCDGSYEFAEEKAFQGSFRLSTNYKF